jgi:hypothetical protein
MRVAAKAFDFELTVSGIERVTERRRQLRRTLEAEPCGFFSYLTDQV